jgi:S-adenosylmethionine:tRNA ribosyltransferase-isomerase
MKTSDFFFELPEELIAQYPPETRGTSRLMVLDRETGNVSHRGVEELPELLEPETLIVFNDSRVRKARLYGDAVSGTGRVEFLLLERTGPAAWRTLAGRAKRQKTGREYRFPGGLSGRIAAEEQDGFRILEFSSPVDDAYLDRYGHVPLPPYIRREDDGIDAERYQTVYSRATGSAAAPTAGLHFTGALLERLHARGMETVFVTLHVGLGTFLPVRTELLEDHRMHEEEYTISEESAEKINRALAEGRRILAVGTTSVRTLESAWDGGRVKPGAGKTRLFIYPGYRFNVVSEIFTNFHTPGSSLLMLVSAFAGKGFIDRAYREAVEERYRFFSYGDAMLIR